MAEPYSDAELERCRFAVAFIDPPEAGKRLLATIDADRARIAELEAERGRLAGRLLDVVSSWATDPADFDRCVLWIKAGCPPEAE